MEAASEDKTVKKVVQGVSEAGVSSDDYFYMTVEEFVLQMLLPPSERTIFWHGVYRKRTTCKKIWVLTVGEIE